LPAAFASKLGLITTELPLAGFKQLFFPFHNRYGGNYGIWGVKYFL